MGFFQHNERKLHYQLFVHPQQAAPLVIYLHGLLMDNLSSAYFTFTHRLKEHAHVLLFDLVGHGRSEFVTSGYQLSDHLLDLKALLQYAHREIFMQSSSPNSTLDSLGEQDEHQQEVILVGCSFGGVLGLYAAQHIEGVQSVVLLEGHIGHRHFLQQLKADLSAQGTQAEHLIVKHFQHWLHRGSERKRIRLMKRAKQLIEQSSLLDDLKHEESLASANRLLQVPKRILYLYGEHSDALEDAENLYQTRLEQGCESDCFHTFPNRSHALLWEETEAVTTAICQWILNPRSLVRPSDAE